MAALLRQIGNLKGNLLPVRQSIDNFRERDLTFNGPCILVTRPNIPFNVVFVCRRNIPCDQRRDGLDVAPRREDSNDDQRPKASLELQKKYLLYFF